MTAFRKIVTVTEQVFSEDGGTVEPATRTAMALVVLQNPWAGHGPVTDQVPLTGAADPGLAADLAARLMTALGGPVETCGTATAVGVAGDIEHGSALVQALGFGDALWEATGGPLQPPVVAHRCEAGAAWDIPLEGPSALAGREHYRPLQARVADAPRADEIVVGLAAAGPGRPTR